VPLSYSQLSSYRACPRQYEYGYIKKLPRQISAGESFGSSVHNTLKKWGEREIYINPAKPLAPGQLKLFAAEEPVAPEPLTEEKLLELWNSSFIVEGYETRVEADMARLRGEKLMRFFYDWWKQEGHVVFLVEKGFSLKLDGKKLTGRFDRIEQLDGGLKIIDFKTSEVRTQDQVDADLQLSVYALACEKSLGQPCIELSFIFLTEEGITEVTTERSPSHLKDAAKQILGLEGQISGGDFHPTPSREACRRCQYSNVCDVAAV